MLWREAGYEVTFVSVTNGDAGHQTMGGATLARRRNAEAQQAAKVFHIEYILLDNHDGELMPTLENRRSIIKLIRDHRPDLILGPRPNDYHPDHRYTATLVQDAAYMVTVPNTVAFADHLPSNPIFMYLSDRFQKPYPFIPDVVVDIDPVIDRKIDALAEHVSQFFEWLPYNAGNLDEVPQSDAERKVWFRDKQMKRYGSEADRFRQQLIERYGQERGSKVQHAEAFEHCEYGASLTPEKKKLLFPF